ncbi:MAG: hypothetical protein BGO51_11105 [Rhodospirillales bacterium 69-11]|nr:gluconate 2-dehydrogenase subunit 3 family protein [Rhodospirillales bacterium]OJW29584.1 MAG: hypothetical protein BGO51_11105 [Rhodospirillales bacterium 69-11]
MSKDHPHADTSARYPDYDVLAKWNTPSWNDPTRAAVGQRLQVRDEPRFLSAERFRILKAVCDRIVPQPTDRMNKIAVAGLVDRMLEQTESVGYRRAEMPPLREAWQRGLDALNDEAKVRFGAEFTDLPAGRQDTVLELLQQGDVRSSAWGDLPAQGFFKHRVLHDITVSYYAHPTAWNEIGFGGPASPRGYVRIEANRRDPWEAEEKQGAVHHGD